MSNNLAHYKVFSTFDLQNAYHQVPILRDDRKYTGLEAKLEDVDGGWETIV